MLDVDSVVVTEFNLYLHPPLWLGSNRKVISRFPNNSWSQVARASRRITTAGTPARSLPVTKPRRQLEQEQLDRNAKRAPEYPQLVAELTFLSPHFLVKLWGILSRNSVFTRLNQISRVTLHSHHSDGLSLLKKSKQFSFFQTQLAFAIFKFRNFQTFAKN